MIDQETEKNTSFSYEQQTFLHDDNRIASQIHQNELSERA